MLYSRLTTTFFFFNFLLLLFFYRFSFLHRERDGEAVFDGLGIGVQKKHPVGVLEKLVHKIVVHKLVYFDFFYYLC